MVEHTLGTGEVMRSSRIASSIWAANSEVEWRTENSFVGGSIPPWPPSNICVHGETGKRVALRALWWQHFIGSSPITRTKMSLWRNRQDANGSKPFCYGFNSHQTYHFIEGSHRGRVQRFAKPPSGQLLRGFKSLPFCHL